MNSAVYLQSDDYLETCEFDAFVCCVCGLPLQSSVAAVNLSCLLCLQLQWSNPLNWCHSNLTPLGFYPISFQGLKHTSLQLSLSIFQHSSLCHSFLLDSGRCFSCCSGGCRVLQARGGAAVAFQSAGRGLQWAAKRTRGSTPSSVPATEAEAATVRQEVRSVL